MLLFAVLLGSAGCSLTRIGYEALPTLAQWEIGRYVDLDPAQRAIVTRHVETVLGWHRREELPRYSRFLRELDERVGVRVDAVEVARVRDRLDEAWLALADRLAPGLAELALTLRQEQIAQMHEHVGETQRKAVARFAPGDGESRDEARGRRVVKRAEFFLGDLPAGQAAELRRLAALLPPADEAWLAEREARQRHFIAMLDRLRGERPPPAEATRVVREHLRALWLSRDPARRQRLAESVAASDDLTARLLARADESQRRHLSKVLRGYAEDFETLSGTIRTAAGSR